MKSTRMLAEHGTHFVFIDFINPYFVSENSFNMFMFALVAFWF
jgi:hypothetical protein